MARLMTVPHHFYRGYPTDFNGGRAAARTFQGWDSEDDTLDLDRTALLLMHLPDAGLRPEIAFRPDCERPDLLGTAEWVPRTMDLVTKQLPPLVTAARKAKLQIVHVIMYNWYAKDYPQRQRCLEELASTPAPAQELEPLTGEQVGDWHTRHTQRAFRPTPKPRGANPNVEECQFVPGLEPRDNDLVCLKTWEMHRLLSARGIVNIIYTGWALNWCLWFSPCGMSDMGRLRYQIGAVRGACVAIENGESAVGEKNLEYAYWQTAAMYGYIFDRDELSAALNATANAS